MKKFSKQTQINCLYYSARLWRECQRIFMKFLMKRSKREFCNAHVLSLALPWLCKNTLGLTRSSARYLCVKSTKCVPKLCVTSAGVMLWELHDDLISTSHLLDFGKISCKALRGFTERCGGIRCSKFTRVLRVLCENSAGYMRKVCSVKFSCR